MGIPAGTDVQIPRFKRKLNLISKLRLREVKGLVQGRKAGKWVLDPGEAMPGSGTQTLSTAPESWGCLSPCGLRQGG